MKKKNIYLALKIIISFGFLAFLLFIVDWERAINILRSVQLSSLIFIPLISLIGIIFAAFRWKLLLFDNNIHFPFRLSFWGYWLGSFYSIFLPGVIGGDIIRAGLLINERNCSSITSATIVLLERIIGVTVLFLSMAIILLVTPGTMAILIGTSNRFQLVMFAIVVIVITGIFLVGRVHWPKLLAKYDEYKLVQFFKKPLMTLSLVSDKSLAISMMLSFLFEATDILAVFYITRALRIELPLIFFFSIMPIVYVITILPISLGGLGVREGVLVFFLSQTGILASDAITVSFLIYFNRIIIGGVAGLIQLLKTLTLKKQHQINA